MQDFNHRTVRKLLTVEILKKFEPYSIFAKGEVYDGPNGANICDSGKVVRWVAVRGKFPTWSIRVQDPYTINSNDKETLFFGRGGIWDYERISKFGDKITKKSNIQFLVPCTEEAYKWYDFLN